MSTLCDRLLLYVVIDPSMCMLDPLSVASAAVSGGATAIQLRVKTLTDRETYDLAHEVRQIAPVGEILFLVNDRVDLALASGADGVHLGVDDLQLERARTLVGPDFVIGYSPETDDEAQGSGPLGANYLGVGPVFGTTSKSDAGEAVGLHTVQRRHELSRLPVVGIGGINAFNARSVIESGACGVAVMSAVMGSEDPERATRSLKNALGEASS